MSSLPPRKVARCDTVDSSLVGSVRRLRSSCPSTDLRKCIICQDDKRQRKNRRLLETLHRCTWDRTPATFLNAARVRNDERVLLEIDGADLHAKDVLYHPSCYKDYTSTRALELLAKKQVRQEGGGEPAVESISEIGEGCGGDSSVGHQLCHQLVVSLHSV